MTIDHVSRLVALDSPEVFDPPEPRPARKRFDPDHYEFPKMREGEVILRRLRQSQLYSATLWGLIGGGFYWPILWLGIPLLLIHRAYPYHLITNRRIIEINILGGDKRNKEAHYDTTSVAFDRIVAVKRIDPWGMGAPFGWLRLEIYTADSPEPKMTIRRQHELDAVEHMLLPHEYPPVTVMNKEEHVHPRA